MRLTKPALALTAILAVAACKNEDDKTNTASTTKTQTEMTQAANEEEASPLEALTAIENITLTRNGTEFTTNIRGYCGSKFGKIADCDSHLTQMVQGAASEQKAFTSTSNKLSSSDEFIRAGLQSRPAYHDNEVEKRLAGLEEKIIQKIGWNETFYIIDKVSNIEAADAPLMAHE